MHGKGGAGHIHLALAVIAALLLGLDFVVSNGIALGLFVTVFMLFPVVVWLVAGSRRKGITKEITTAVRKDLSKGHAPRYLKGEPTKPRIGRRVLSVMIAVFGLTSIVMRFVVKRFFPAYVNNFNSEWLAFVFLSLLVLACLPFIFIPAWVKNDAGLRIYDKERLLVTAPGSNMVRLITGVGLLISMVYLFNSFYTLSYVVFAELFLVGPACYLAVASFGVLQERRLTTYIAKDPELNSELVLSIDFTGTQSARVGTQPVSIIHSQQTVEPVETKGE